MSNFTITDNGGLRRAILGLSRVVEEYPTLLQEAFDSTATQVAEQLAEASPKGIGRTGGHLAESFEARSGELSAQVITTQAVKLHYVRYGTGIYGAFHAPIVPVTAHFMWWPEAEHPYAQVRGQPPNDFVTPILDDAVQYALADIDAFVSQLLVLLEGG